MLLLNTSCNVLRSRTGQVSGMIARMCCFLASLGPSIPEEAQVDVHVL